MVDAIGERHLFVLNFLSYTIFHIFGLRISDHVCCNDPSETAIGSRTYALRNVFHPHWYHQLLFVVWRVAQCQMQWRSVNSIHWMSALRKLVHYHPQATKHPPFPLMHTCWKFVKTLNVQTCCFYACTNEHYMLSCKLNCFFVCTTLFDTILNISFGHFRGG